MQTITHTKTPASKALETIGFWTSGFFLVFVVFAMWGMSLVTPPQNPSDRKVVASSAAAPECMPDTNPCKPNSQGNIQHAPQSNAR